MQLYTSPTTPFGRKAMLMLLETGLAGQTTLHEVSGTPIDPGSMPLDRNPLGKIPALERLARPSPLIDNHYAQPKNELGESHIERGKGLLDGVAAL